MATKIDYVDTVWNPVIGCTKCSLGCLNCYAEQMAYRLHAMGMRDYQRVVQCGTGDVWNGKVVCREKELDRPLHLRKSRRILTCSMGDLFHEAVPFEFIKSVLGIIALCPQHTFLLLTKRPEKMAELSGAYPDNVHLGVSISTQKEDWKITELLKIQAVVRWVSLEPMLEAIDLHLSNTRKDILWRRTHGGSYQREFLNWVVIGAESKGPYPGRPCKLDDVRNIVSQCETASVPVWVKQLHIDGKLVRDIKKFPKDLQIRELPNGK